MKMDEKEFVEYIPGIISTTGMDRHGHQIPEEELERWAEKIRSEGIPLTLHHDSDKLVGEWVTAEVISYGSFAALSGIAGVYEGNEDMAEDLNDGEFGGLSITAQDYLNTSEEDWQSVDETLSLSVDSHRTRDSLLTPTLTYEVRIFQKHRSAGLVDDQAVRMA